MDPSLSHGEAFPWNPQIHQPKAKKYIRNPRRGRGVGEVDDLLGGVVGDDDELRGQVRVVHRDVVGVQLLVGGHTPATEKPRPGRIEKDPSALDGPCVGKFWARKTLRKFRQNFPLQVLLYKPPSSATKKSRAQRLTPVRRSIEKHCEIR